MWSPVHQIDKSIYPSPSETSTFKKKTPSPSEPKPDLINVSSLTKTHELQRWSQVQAPPPSPSPSLSQPIHRSAWSLTSFILPVPLPTSPSLVHVPVHFPHVTLMLITPVHSLVKIRSSKPISSEPTGILNLTCVLTWSLQRWNSIGLLYEKCRLRVMWNGKRRHQGF